MARNLAAKAVWPAVASTSADVEASLKAGNDVLGEEPGCFLLLSAS